MLYIDWGQVFICLGNFHCAFIYMDLTFFKKAQGKDKLGVYFPPSCRFPYPFCHPNLQQLSMFFLLSSFLCTHVATNASIIIFHVQTSHIRLCISIELIIYFALELWGLTLSRHTKQIVAQSWRQESKILIPHSWYQKILWLQQSDQ